MQSAVVVVVVLELEICFDEVVAKREYGGVIGIGPDKGIL